MDGKEKVIGIIVRSHARAYLSVFFLHVAGGRG